MEPILNEIQPFKNSKSEKVRKSTGIKLSNILKLGVYAAYIE